MEIPCWLPTALDGGKHGIKKPTGKRTGNFLTDAPILMIKVKVCND